MSWNNTPISLTQSNHKKSISLERNVNILPKPKTKDEEVLEESVRCKEYKVKKSRSPVFNSGYSIFWASAFV